MSEATRHPFVALRLRPDQIDLAELRLWELGATGLEQRDASTIDRELVEDDIVLLAAFSDETTACRALEDVRDDYDASLLYVPHENWATEWRRGFSTQRIGKRLLLHPSWETVHPSQDDIVITIDPENAFGSGDHETTRLVLRLLDERVRGGERVLDVGCGSGILSIAATLLGAASAVAIDVEEDAVLVTARNAALNGVASRVDSSTTPVAETVGVFDLVLANIETRVLVEMPETLRKRMAPGAILVLSGVLRTEREELLAAYRGMQLDELVEEGQWCACVLRSETES